MDTNLEYTLMCQDAKEIQDSWKPQMGDYMVSMASYCCDEESNCSNGNSCPDCLESSNVYVISGQYDYHESIGGTHWFFGGGACVKGEGNFCNDTKCFIMTTSGISEIGHRFNTSSKTDKLWLPRQDQIQSMFWNGYTEYKKAKVFATWLDIASFNPHTYSLEMLWLMCYMECIHNKKWNSISNVKQWEEISR